MKKAILSLMISMLTLLGAQQAQAQQTTLPLGSWKIESQHMQIESPSTSFTRIFEYEFDRISYQFLAQGKGFEIIRYDHEDPTSVEKRSIIWKTNGNKLTVNYAEATEEDKNIFDNFTFTLQGENLTIKGSFKEGDEHTVDQYKLKKKK